MSKQGSLKKWWQVYNSDEEKNFFVGKDGISGLVRNKEYEWRSTDALSRESGLSKAKVEEYIDFYNKAGIVIQHKNDPEKWGYWENVAPDLANQKKLSVGEEDQQKRLDKAKKK